MIRLTTTDVAHGGYCVGRHEGIVVLVTGALPGETVDAQITERRSRLWYGRTAGVISASPDRVAHIWPLAEREGVGGADLGHVAWPASWRWKARVVETQLARIAHLAVPVTVEPVPSDSARAGLAWRTRLTLRVTPDGGLGMHAPRSRRIVPIDTMPLAHEDIQTALAAHRPDPRAPSGSAVTYVRASDSSLVRLGGSPGAAGSPRVTESVGTASGTWTYQVSAGGFWQVHRGAPAVLVEAVLAAVGEAEGPVWDLYAGAGLFTLPLAARTAGPVTAVEGAPGAVADLRRNTAGLGVRCLEGDVATVLRGESGAAGVVVCDPPRSGAGRAVVAQIQRLAPERVVYVACDPASLARDVGLLVAQGYRLAGLRAFDLFPMTHHVECVALLTR